MSDAIVIPHSKYVEFIKSDMYMNKDLRTGQAFHNFMQLEKITGPSKRWCDDLWAASDSIATRMILNCIDYNH